MSCLITFSTDLVKKTSISFFLKLFASPLDAKLRVGGKPEPLPQVVTVSVLTVCYGGYSQT